MPPPLNPQRPIDNGEIADNAMQGAGVTEWALKGTVGFERLRRLAQGRAGLAKAAGSIGKGISKVAGPLGVALEAGNAAWLASDATKRARVEADFEETAKKSAPERMIEGALNATDTLFATGKAAYDAGKTYESVERSQMDEINNSLLRKIAKHEAEAATPPNAKDPLSEAWMRNKALKQREQQQQQEEANAITLAKDSLSAIVAPRTLGGRSPLRFNGGKPPTR